MQGRIVLALLAASLLPLALTGGGAWVVFGRLLAAKALEVHAAVVTGHAATIELYFAERRHALELAARTHSIEELRGEGGLEELFRALNATHDDVFVDLGVIDSEGHHVAYVGPYDLRGRRYADAAWFQRAMASGVYVSDGFLGYRGVPHSVMAVRRVESGERWILRATLNGDKLDALVRTGLLGDTGDAFLVNGEGTYQTSPRVGSVLGRSALRSPQAHRGVRHSRVEHAAGASLLQATTWIGEPRWMLVVQQDEREIRAPVRQAMLVGALVILIAVIVVVVTTVVATRHLTGQIAAANRERDAMSKDLLRSAKLASLGELATGLAHEINNPLGIISAEKTNVSDVLAEASLATDQREEVGSSLERIGRQVTRCAAITSKMLQFGRHGGGALELVDVRPRLEEIVALLERQARVRNVDLKLSVQEGLPAVKIDATELEQVVVNLVSNSLQAIEGPGAVEIGARSEDDTVLVTVTDDGPGIAPEHLDKIFQPFFTTKPVGRGTGLGLSVCYGIVSGWGGSLSAASELGHGTCMTVRLPVPNDSGPPRKGKETPWERIRASGSSSSTTRPSSSTR